MGLPSKNQTGCACQILFSASGKWVLISLASRLQIFLLVGDWVELYIRMGLFIWVFILLIAGSDRILMRNWRFRRTWKIKHSSFYILLIIQRNAIFTLLSFQFVCSPSSFAIVFFAAANRIFLFFSINFFVIHFSSL